MKIKQVYKFLIILSCIFAMNLNGIAQTKKVTGKVYNSSTGEVLSGIKIQIKGTNLSTISEKSGKYSIEVPDSISIRFAEYPGTKIKDIKVHNPNNIDIYLAELSVQDLFALSFDDLMQLTITTAGKKEEQLSDIPASAVIVTRSDIEKYGYTTLAEILENVPGMYMINDYSWDGHYKFGVRGYWSDMANAKLMIFVNGVNQKDDIFNSYPINKIAVPVETIERIEIIRGPMSVIYGSGAFFGVINIITRQISDTSNNQVTFSAGSQNTKKVSLNYSGKSDNFNLAINGGYYSTNGINQPYSKMMSLSEAQNMPTETTDGLLNLNEVFFNLTGGFNDFYADLSYVETNDEIYLILPSLKDGSVSNYKSSNSQFGYKNKLSDKFSLDAKIGYFSTSLTVDYDWLYTPAINYQTISSKAIEFDINTFFYPNKKTEITVGFYNRVAWQLQNRLHIPTVGWEVFHNTIQEIKPEDNVNTLGLFGQVDFTPNKNFKLVAGIRLEHLKGYSIWNKDAGEKIGEPAEITFNYDYKQEGIAFIPRLAGIWNINNNNAFKLLYGKAISRPSFWQLTSVQTDLDNLSSEVIQTFELNYIANTSTISTNISLFYNKLDNLIVRDHGIDSTGEYYNIMTNSGKMNTFGTEFTVQYKPTDNWLLELSTTYQHTTDKFHDIEPGYSPNLLAYTKMYYNTSKFTFALIGNYVGEMESFWNSNPDGTGQRISNADFDGYFSLGANIRLKQLLHKNLFLNIRGNNLLNAEIRYPTYNNNPFFTKGTLGSKSSIIATVGWKF